jgi:hypothetical protein
MIAQISHYLGAVGAYEEATGYYLTNYKNFT